jgi:hypothetical protein
MQVDHTSRKFLLEPEKPLLEFRAIGSKVREACSTERTLILITTQISIAANLVLEHDFRI